MKMVSPILRVTLALKYSTARFIAVGLAVTSDEVSSTRLTVIHWRRQIVGNPGRTSDHKLVTRVLLCELLYVNEINVISIFLFSRKGTAW
jgi:hypothetical protein